MIKFALLLLLVVLGEWATHAQGTIQFQNSSSFPIKIATGTDPASLAAAVVIGSSNAPPGVGPGQVDVQLYVALASAPTQFFLAGTTTNSGSTSALFLGTFHGGSPYSIPTSIDGGAFMQGATIDYYFSADAAIVYFGTSAIGTGYVLSGGAGSPGATFGTGTGEIGGFIMQPVAPEPSVMILSGLGALAALLYRRRK